MNKFLNVNKVMNSIFFTQDLLKVFNEFAGKLDKYFSNEDNKNNNSELYLYYKDLKDNIITLTTKYKVIK